MERTVRPESTASAGAITEILSEEGLDLNFLRQVLDAADESLRAVEDRLVLVGAASAKYALMGGVVVSDERLLRENFVTKIYDVLVRHGLDSTTTSKSPIAFIIIELEGTSKSEREKFAHVKTVAAWVRGIVNPQKGG